MSEKKNDDLDAWRRLQAALDRSREEANVAKPAAEDVFAAVGRRIRRDIGKRAAREWFSAEPQGEQQPRKRSSPISRARKGKRASTPREAKPTRNM